MSSNKIINIISLFSYAASCSHPLSLSLGEWWSNIFKNALTSLSELSRISLHTISLVAWSLAASLLRPLHQVMNIIVICRLGGSSHKFRLNASRLRILLTSCTRSQQELLVAGQWISPSLDCEIISLGELLLHTMSLKPRCYKTKIWYERPREIIYLLLSDLLRRQMI